MKYVRYITALAGVLCLTHNIFANNYDFRKTRWGMPTAQVKAIEDLKSNSKFLKEIPAQNSVSKTAVAYTVWIFNRKCILLYQFTHGRLSEGAYDFDVKNLDPETVGKLYFKIGKEITDKYGKGVSKGRTGFRWFTANKRTEIVLQFNLDDEKIQVMYFSLIDKPINDETPTENPF